MSAKSAFNLATPHRPMSAGNLGSRFTAFDQADSASSGEFVGEGAHVSHNQRWIQRFNQEVSRHSYENRQPWINFLGFLEN
ncbi:hypothetical protein JOE65_000205 [Arthrobacter roseus]|nr:hypothetical protein [Arthrobacter roseus]